jgi:hypothetical protein
MIHKAIKIILIILLFACLLELPYEFYEFVRFIALIGFGILAYQSKSQYNNTEMVVYGTLALLFQPFFKIALGRDIWIIIDVIVALGLILNLIMRRNTLNRTSFKKQ